MNKSKNKENGSKGSTGAADEGVAEKLYTGKFESIGHQTVLYLGFGLLNPKYTFKIYNMMTLPDFVLWHDKTTTGIHPARSNFITF